MIQRNYLEVYIYEKWSDKEIIDYESVSEFEPTSIDLNQGTTEPPPLLTEADLISLVIDNSLMMSRKKEIYSWPPVTLKWVFTYNFMLVTTPPPPTCVTSFMNFLLVTQLLEGDQCKTPFEVTPKSFSELFPFNLQVVKLL